MKANKVEFHNHRDKMMAEAITEFSKTKKGKIFGMMGSFHTDLNCGWAFVSQLVKNETIFKEKTLISVIACQNSMAHTSGPSGISVPVPQDVFKIYDEKNSKELRNKYLAKSDCEIFILPIDNEDKVDKKFYSSAHYIIIAKNQKAMTKIIAFIYFLIATSGSTSNLCPSNKEVI